MKKNKIIANVLCLGISLSSVFGFGLAKGSNSNAEQSNKFVPVFRMAICSDTHVTIDDNTMTRRFEKFFDSAYSYAESQDYKNLDAIVNCGDLTHNNTYADFIEYRKVVSEKVRKDTQYMDILGNHDLYKLYNGGFTEEVYKTLIKQELNTHIVVNGFHIIGISNDDSSARFNKSFSDDSDLGWTNQQLLSASKDDDEKPIFVFQHEHVPETVWNSKTCTDGGSSLIDNKGYVNGLFSRYPQVIDFSGHSHCPALNPRGIYQKDYTCVDLPTFKDTGITCIHDTTMVNSGFLDTYNGEKFGFDNSFMKVENTPRMRQDDANAFYRIVEVDKNNTVRIYTYDMVNNCLAKTSATDDGDATMLWEIEEPSNKATFKYTDEAYKDTTAPTWQNGAEITITESEGVNYINFPQALDDSCVYAYKVIYRKAGTDCVYNYLDEFFIQENSELETFPINVESGEYEIIVTAWNVWGLESTQLTKNIVL